MIDINKMNLTIEDVLFILKQLEDKDILVARKNGLLKGFIKNTGERYLINKQGALTAQFFNTRSIEQIYIKQKEEEEKIIKLLRFKNLYKNKN
jgi:hypothetical protein